MILLSEVVVRYARHHHARPPPLRSRREIFSTETLGRDMQANRSQLPPAQTHTITGAYQVAYNMYPSSYASKTPIKIHTARRLLYIPTSYSRYCTRCTNLLRSYCMRVAALCRTRASRYRAIIYEPPPVKIVGPTRQQPIIIPFGLAAVCVYAMPEDKGPPKGHWIY